MAGQSEVEFQESMVLQREQEILSLQNGVEDINHIYNSLAELVGTQGADLDIIHNTSVGIVENTMMAYVEYSWVFLYVC